MVVWQPESELVRWFFGFHELTIILGRDLIMEVQEVIN